MKQKYMFFWYSPASSSSLCSCHVDCLAWGIPALEPTGCGVGPGLGLRWLCLGQFTPMNTPWYLCHRFPCPHSESQLPPASPRDPPRSAGRSGPGCYAVTVFFPPGPGVDKSLCASSKSGVSVFPSPVEFLWSSPAGLQSQMLWGLFFPVSDPQTGEPDVCGPRLSLLWENLCDIIVFHKVLWILKVLIIRKNKKELKKENKGKKIFYSHSDKY